MSWILGTLSMVTRWGVVVVIATILLCLPEPGKLMAPAPD
jgi:hypothetical protein